MSKEIIINKGKQTRIAIVENGELAELFIENQEHERTIGNIFLGRVRRVMPSIQAAFVDIGQKQDAFLHFSDLIDNVESWLDFVQTDQAEIGSFKGDYTTKPAGKKRRRPSGQERGGRGGRHQNVADKDHRDRRKSAHGRQHGSHESRSRDRQEQEQPKFDPAQILKKDQPVLVKISKEPIANKGSRITTDISLAGRFLVLVPMANYVAVSKKIMSFKERRRLRALARSLLPEGFGVIVRTVAEGRSAKALDTDLNLLVDKWKKMEGRLKQNPKPPSVIHEDVNMVSSIMRDLFTEDYDRILVDDQKLYRNLRGYVQAIAPDMIDDVKLEEDADSVFQKVGIKDSVEEAFDERVNMPSGGYLFFEQTEAMHVVDVNSGRAGRGMSQEDSSLKVNLEAARVICKQVRLRDLGGIIVVDFIDMRHESNRRKLYETLKREFRADRAVTKVLPMSDFGLIQITRQRLRPSITTTFSLPDEQSGDRRPEGRSRRKETRDRSVQSGFLRIEPEDLLKKIEGWLGTYGESGQSARVRLRVHPFTASFLSGKFPSRTFRWRLRFGVRVQIEADPSVDPMTFRFFDDASGKEISRLPSRKNRDSRRKKDGGSRSGPSKSGRGKAESTESKGRSSRSGRGRSERSEGRDGGSEKTRSERSDSGRSRSQRSGSGRSGSERSGSERSNESRSRSDSERSRSNRSRGRGRSSDSRQRSSDADQAPRSESSSRSESRSRADESPRSDSRSRGDERSNSGGRKSSESRSRSDNRRNDGRGRRRDQESSEKTTQAPKAEATTPKTEKQRADRRKPAAKAERDDVWGSRSEEASNQQPKQTPKADPVAAPAPEGNAGRAAESKSRSDAPAKHVSEGREASNGPKARNVGEESKGQDHDNGPKDAGSKKAPAKTKTKPEASQELPASNRFMKIDLRSDSGS
jgi:ribonuclease G